MYVFYVHLHANGSHPYTPLYQIQITKKIPQNIANLFALLQLQSSPALADNAYYNGWGGRKIDIGLRPSDIKIDPRAVVETSSSNSGDEVSTAKTFNNEGKYWWDVSVGVPAKKIGDLKFDSTNNTVTPTQTGTQNAFALLDFYLPPVDLSQTNYSFIPHPIVGVAMAKQPLHKILVGGAVGLHYAEIYVGVMFVKQQSVPGLPVGTPGTPQQVASISRFSFDHQFTVGINLPVRNVVNAVKSKAKQ